MGKSKDIYIISESVFLRSIIGLDDIDPLKGVFHIGPWPDFYQVGQYYGIAGIETHIFGQAERITIETTFQTCYINQRNKQWDTAHLCYDTTLNYIEANTKNINLQNIALESNLTDFVPMIQFYLSQPSTVNTLKAPTTRLFQAHSPKAQAQLYTDMAKNYDANITQYLRDYLSVKNIFIAGNNDFISYRKAIKDWLENKVQFVESDKFKNLPMQV